MYKICLRDIYFNKRLCKNISKIYVYRLISNIKSLKILGYFQFTDLNRNFVLIFCKPKNNYILNRNVWNLDNQKKENHYLRNSWYANEQKFGTKAYSYINTVSSFNFLDQTAFWKNCQINKTKRVYSLNWKCFKKKKIN